MKDAVQDGRFQTPSSGRKRRYAVVGPPQADTSPQVMGSPLPPHAIPPPVRAPMDEPREGGRCSSTISGLSSAIVHLAMLILLAVFLVPQPHRDGYELRFTVAEAPSVALESHRFSARVEVANTEIPEALEDAEAGSTAPSLAIEEPALVTDLEAGQGWADTTFGLEALAPSRGSFVPPLSGKRSGTIGSDGKGEFFGLHAYGDKFVYVLDSSTSMARQSRYGRTRYQVAADEVARSVGNLSEEQKFFVIVFSYGTRFLFDNRAGLRMLPATSANKRLLRDWLNRIQLAPGTDPRMGIMASLRMKPSAVFLLSDGEFNGRRRNLQNLPGNPTVEHIVARHRRGDTPIHTVALEDKHNRKRLRRLALATGGSHRFVTRKEDSEVLMEDLTSNRPEDVLDAVQPLGRDGLGPARTISGRTRLDPLVRKPQLRELAHRAPLALSDGEDFGPRGEPPTRDEIKDAQRRWRSY